MLSDPDFEFLQRLMRTESGIVVEADKGYLVEARLAGLLRRLGLETTTEFVRMLASEGSRDLRRQTVEAMANGETLFFRDFAMFEVLRTAILPALIAARANERRLCIWSAACSTGQEPYSLAMLLADKFPELEGWDVRIVATDLSHESLGRARSGTYSQFEINRGLPALMLVRHFVQGDGGFQVTSRIRDAVEFRQHNLLRDAPPFPTIDLMLLRNVMIYWELETKRAVLERAKAAFRHDAVLILGAAESTHQIEDIFERVGHPGASSYRPTEPGGSRS